MAIKKHIDFYTAETKSNHIIAYGDWWIFKRKFKITYHDGMYFAHHKISRQYWPIGEAPTLDVAKDLCKLKL